MTKREEIREGMKELLSFIYCGQGAWVRDADVTTLLAYLHSQGVVMKVDREEYYDSAERMYDVGYVAVEPLIKE